MSGPEKQQLHYLYHGYASPGDGGIFYEDLEIDNSFPVLLLYRLYSGEDKGLYSFLSSGRGEHYTPFYNYAYAQQKALEQLDENSSCAEYKEIYVKKGIFTSTWKEALCLYYDYLSVIDIEEQSRRQGQEPHFFLILKQKDSSGRILQYRWLYSFFSLEAARYFLRQEYTNQENRWHCRQMFSHIIESVFTKEVSSTVVYDSLDQRLLSVKTSFPHAKKGKKPPFTHEWHWYISRSMPTLEALSSSPQETEREDERWNFRPGDPRLLRETGTGQYGSYPVFEGDDEPEYRDEN